MQNFLLIIFARTPKLGRVKTRLAKVLGDERALIIHQQLLNHTIETAKNTGLPFKVYLSDPAVNGQTFDFQLQRGRNLGARMDHAIRVELKQNKRVCLIGSDCPDLTSNDIAKAFQLLESADVVLGPATDGGYYLIGMKKPYPQLFTNITWGTSSVLANTLKICETNNLQVKLLRQLNDVDHPGDLPEAWQ
jgi:uncharacterized protein